MSVPTCDPAGYKISFVTDENFLDEATESNRLRHLLAALAERGWSCEVLCRVLTANENETETDPRSAEHREEPALLPPLETAVEMAHQAEPNGVLRKVDRGVTLTIFHDASSMPHTPNGAEQDAFLRRVVSTLDRRRPDLVLVRAGSYLAGILALARARRIATVALQPDCTPRSAAPFRDADIVLVPCRFTADYLRNALDLPCIHLPPLLVPQRADSEPLDYSLAPAVVVGDDSSPGNGRSVVAQIASALSRLRPDIAFVLLGTQSLDAVLANRVGCLSRRERGRIGRSACVLLAPQVSWEQTPQCVLSALLYGIPTIASDRGALPEILNGGGLLLPLPDRITMAHAKPLEPAELSPWVETIANLCDDRTFAAHQHDLALRAGRRYILEEALPHYTRFFAGLIERRRGVRLTERGGEVDQRVPEPALSQLKATYPWPTERPPDAAPGLESGWFGGGTELMLQSVLSSTVHLVVEVGSWLGLSTRFIADRVPRATIVAIDHWQGSAEHKNEESFAALLPHLYETFLARCWDYREQIVPLRADALTGLRSLAAMGLQPNFIFVDAEHGFEAVTAQLTLARQLFPQAALGGDDYDWQSVRAAVDDFAARYGLGVDRFGTRGWRLRESWEMDAANRPPPGRGQWLVFVPHLNGIERECEEGLHALERAGVRVVRRGGSSAIDVARNEMASAALHEAAEAILFIDADIGFDPQDALRLLARPEAVVAGIYAKKGLRELTSIVAEDVPELLFGPETPGPYPLKYAAAGFLRIRVAVLQRLIVALELPPCNTHWGPGVWPFFQPAVVAHGPGKKHYLGEDWAFSHRLEQIGVTPLADTSIRLWHWGRYGFSWEDAGSEVTRYRSYNYRLKE